MELHELLNKGINELLKLNYREKDLIIRINPITYIELIHNTPSITRLDIILSQKDYFPKNLTYRGIEVQKGMGYKIHIISNHIYRNEYIEIDKKKITFKLIK